MSELDGAVAELERAAARLRSGELDPDEAADLVERCAELATEVGAALDRRASEPPPDADQERLL